MLDSSLLDKLRSGCVIPAHPLALQKDNGIDERRQRALTRYYLAAGAGGLAVGVHTTQFAIHDAKIGLYRPVLELAMETAREAASRTDCGEPIMIAGILGGTEQAVREAQLARELGYHLGLLSLTALRGKSVDELIDHCREVASVIPVMGFYLQEVISQMVLPAEFWQRFTAIPNVHAVKIAPFNRYQTLDVLEAVAHSGRSGEIAYRQRRQHYRRFAHKVRIHGRGQNRAAPDSRRPARPMGLLDKESGRAHGPDQEHSRKQRKCATRSDNAGKPVDAGQQGDFRRLQSFRGVHSRHILRAEMPGAAG